jgi:ABC-type transporter Mla MlaB component
MPLSLDGDICLSRMLEVANTLRAALADSADVELDGTIIRSIDFAGIQLLVAARRSSLRSGGDFRVIVPPTGPLREALVTYGYADPSSHGSASLPFVDGALQ